MAIFNDITNCITPIEMEYKKNIGQKIIYLLKTWDIAKKG